jgi:hypothetical protein
MKRGPLSLVSTTEELLGSNSSVSGLEIREYSRRDLFFFYLYIYFGVGLESPFCQLQAIYIKLLKVDSTQILYKTHTEHTQTSMPKWDSNPRSQCWSGRKQFVP